jgi:hypothetical protein
MPKSKLSRALIAVVASWVVGFNIWVLIELLRF